MNVRAPYRSVCLSLLLGSAAASAQIVTDGTVGPATRLSGPEMTVGAELGSTRGANLFHSFQRFDIPNGQTATFTGPDQIQNVIGRVTGGAASSLDGTLRSTVGQADVYLINPSGVVMGPNARLDVPAALHLSTADELRFSDGSRYSASDPANSTLTLAAPESFGFLSPQPASLTIAGSQLELKPGKTATLTAGDVSLSGTTERRATLTAPGGEIRVEAVGDRGRSVLVHSSSETLGNGALSISQADLKTSGEGGGHIGLSAGQARLQGTRLFADNRGATKAVAGVDVHVAGSAQLTDRSTISTNTYGAGSAGNVTIRAGALRLYDASLINSEVLVDATGNAGSVRLDITDVLELSHEAMIDSGTFGAGAAGRVAITTRDLRVDDGAQISSGVYLASGAGGLVSVVAQGQAEVLNHAQIMSSTYGTGRAGTVEVMAGELRLAQGGRISSDAIFGSGDAGEVRIEADVLRMEGFSVTQYEDIVWRTGITSQAANGSSGNAGQVLVDVKGLLELSGYAAISAETFGLGNAGRLDVRAGRLRLDGVDSLIPPQIVSSTSFGETGAAGWIRVEVEGSAELWRGAQIETSTYGSGDAGEIVFEAGALYIDSAGSSNVTGILSQATDVSSGRAGDLTVRVTGPIELIKGGLISSTTANGRDAGLVEVEAGALRIDGVGFAWVTGIVSDTYASGHARQVSVAVSGSAELIRGGVISSSTVSTGHAGMVRVKAGDLRIDAQGADDPAAIGTQAAVGSTGHAGRVTVEVAGRLEILNGGLIDSSTFGAGDAGHVRVEANDLRIDGSHLEWGTGIASVAESQSSGRVGTVTVQARTLTLLDQGKITIEAKQTAFAPTTDAASNDGLYVEANTLALSGGKITAQSTGPLPAAAIRIQADELHLTNTSRITTEAAQNHAGLIEIGGGRLWLTDSLITTSANGAIGDGGDITLTPEYLILDGGFIQANTAATGASGGDIRIDTRALIAREGLVEIGGAVRQDFAVSRGLNIIQAAAPGGEQGTIDVTSPDLDITAALVPLATAFDDPDDLLTDLCRGVTGSSASSLTERGAGGLPAAPFAPAAVSFMGTRLDRMHTP
jgi:filamentous hemagglutinin family protein